MQLGATPPSVTFAFVSGLGVHRAAFHPFNNPLFCFVLGVLGINTCCFLRPQPLRAEEVWADRWRADPWI